jgi:hypothetical protein
MSNQEVREEDRPAAGTPSGLEPGESQLEEEGPRNPFDNPYFLPVLLFALSVWFGYDAFFNADEHMQKPTTLWFNRVGFVVLIVLGIWFTLRARGEAANADDSAQHDR